MTRPRLGAARRAWGLLLGLGLGLGTGCESSDGSGLPPKPVFGLDVRGDALFVATGNSGAVVVVDVESWSIVGTLALSKKYHPNHLGMSPDRLRIGVGAPGSALPSGGQDAGTSGGALYVLDSQKGDVTAQALPGGTAHNLAFIDDARVAYGLTESGRAVLAGAADLAPSIDLPVGSAPLEVSPSAAGLLVANSGSGSISVVRVSDPPAVTAMIAVGQNPTGVWPGATGRAYVTSGSDRTLSALTLTGSGPAVERAVTLPGSPVHALAVGGELWVAQQDPPRLLILNAADLTQKDSREIAKKPHAMCLSPRGLTVFLTDEADGRVYSIDVATRAVLRVMYVGGEPAGIVYRAALP